MNSAALESLQAESDYNKLFLDVGMDPNMTESSKIEILQISIQGQKSRITYLYLLICMGTKFYRNRGGRGTIIYFHYLEQR